MIKLQQFKTLSFNYKRLANNNFDIKITPKEATFNDEIISLGDNEVLRAIRKIINHPYNNETLNSLIKNRKLLLKKENSKENREKIKQLNNEICKQTFVFGFVSVDFKTENEYTDLNKRGFYINNEKFVWLMCGASHQRTNRAMYVAEYVYAQLDKILTNGANVGDIVLAKYNAYYALSSSATYKVRMPKVICVPDKEIQMLKEVDFAENCKIERCEKELSFNLFDGQGLISPDFSRDWAEDVEIFDYIPSAWGIRCAFIKGMCVTFDFHKFAKEIAHKNTIIDVWGNEQNIFNADIILTESQFKLWNCYENWENYEKELQKSGFSWGVSKISPRISDEKTYMFTNYQFLQVLQLDNDDINGLCQPTIDWLKGVSCKNIDYTELYLLGKFAKSQNGDDIFDKIQDNFLKCLILNNKLINDDYCKNRIIKSVGKKINDSYYGNLIIDGNFMARISDPYALCEHIFGLQAKGLLGSNEHFCWFWNQRGEKEVVAMRSPLTYKTEAHKLNLKDTVETNEWYKYLTSGIVYNVWGVDCLLEGGADYDFDITATTNNKYFLKGVLNSNIPVVYNAKKPQKEKIDNDKLIKIAGVGFNTKIGYLTNLSTTLYEMQSQYNKGSIEWNEIELRLKLCCELQSMQIDKAKGLVIDDIPKYWTSYNCALRKDNGIKGLNCDLLIDDRPYFMRYRYKKYNKKYKNTIFDFKKYENIVWGQDSGIHKDTNEYKEMVDYCSKKTGLLKTNGIVNRVCNHMEQELCDLRVSQNTKNTECVYDLLIGDETIIDTQLLEKMLVVYEKYLAFKKNKCLEESEYSNWNQYFKAISNQCLAEISSNIAECAKLAVYICYKLYPTKPKDFCWDCFGSGIVLNIIQNVNKYTIPLININGDVKYLGEYYKQTEFKVNNKNKNTELDNNFEYSDDFDLNFNIYEGI